jgi:hypothetical protein
MTMKRAAFLLAASAAAACQSPSGSEEIRVSGTLEYHGSPVTVEVPAQVVAGSDFQVALRTWGGGCTRAGEVEVRGSARTLELEPFDYMVRGPDIACPDLLGSFDHVATLRFASPGAAVVRIVGRREPGGDRITVERPVEVLPAP